MKPTPTQLVAVGVFPLAKLSLACLLILILLGFAGLAFNNRHMLTGLIWKTGPRIMFSREALSNGRTDTIRPLSLSNPMGLRAVAGFGDPDSGRPGLLTTIAAQPNPVMISIDQDRDGRLDGRANPIVSDLGNLLSCYSLLVAEEFPAEGTRWENIGNRDGAGSLYATVTIPSAGIVAGQELITDSELSAYNANSILYEAPDYGVSPASTIDTKGAINVRAAPRPQPNTPRLKDLIPAPEINYARDVKVEIEVVSFSELYDGKIELCLRAKLTGFDPIIDSHFRWAYDGNGVKIVEDIMGDDRIAFHLPADQKGQLVRLWVAVSSKGLGVGNPNPFVQQPPNQEIGNMTFVTAGSAVAAMRPYTVKAKPSVNNSTILSAQPRAGYVLANVEVLRTYFNYFYADKRYTLEKPGGETFSGDVNSFDFGYKHEMGPNIYGTKTMKGTLTVTAPPALDDKATSVIVSATARGEWEFTVPPDESPPASEQTKARVGLHLLFDQQAVFGELKSTPDRPVTSGKYSVATQDSQSIPLRIPAGGASYEPDRKTIQVRLHIDGCELQATFIYEKIK